MTAAIRRLCSNFVKSLDIVDKSHIALDELTSSGDIVRSKRLLLDKVMEARVKSFFHRLGQEPFQFVERTGIDCFVSCWYRRPEIAAGWFQAGIGFSLTRPMDAHQRLEEVTVRHFLWLRPKLAGRQCLIESASDFANVFGSHPNQDTVEVAGLQRDARSTDDRPIKAVAMGQSRRRVEETHRCEHDDESNA